MCDSAPAAAKAGWYPTPVHGRERYWDGVRWTEMFRQAQAGAPRPIGEGVTSAASTWASSRGLGSGPVSD
ncbi:hypothetical protein ASF40_11625 [Microbacterium sp. Leaf288]|uniref:DUF2510 domain-containing protein n=1 Tax=Microbacterium sp. Leaf288 TaxID=1736323 RepID=UPI0006F86D8D|nr:DUF2510 domain-containing protein [Microbacterium sp. Leaf288]KQP70424.1 hypothetical protein ASF40_11625 [Microbacterium sp. Leaf288]